MLNKSGSHSFLAVVTWPDLGMPPVAAAAAIASARKPAGRKGINHSSKYLYLYYEKQKLEHLLTTSFPNKNDVVFDKDLELLMMNG